MSEIAKKVRLFDGIRFSDSTPLLVPTVQTREGATQVNGLPFHEDPSGVIEFSQRMSQFTGDHDIVTDWGKGNLKVNGYWLRLIIPNRGEDDRDNMLFYLDMSQEKISAVLEYRTPLLYLLQFAELPIRFFGQETSSGTGIAATLVAGGQSLCKKTAIHTSKGFIPLRSASGVARNAVYHDMRDVDEGYLFESTSIGYGYTVSGGKHTARNAPRLSVHYIGGANCDDAPILHEHDLENPSIAVLQNIPISAQGMFGKVEPIITDLVHAAANMCPTLPMARAV
jgi:hypothetical protein